MEPAPGEITLLLGRWKLGDAEAFDQLMPLIYPHLREVAAAYIRREKNPGILQATVLVHDLYLRLLQQRKADWKDRSHFYTFAARVMRMILMDHARGVSAQKRGASAEHVPLSPDLPWIDVGSSEMIALNSALDELNKVDPDMVRLVELRYFLGCTADEAADIHQISKATVNRNLKLAKSWLYRYLHPDAGGGAVPP